MDDQPLGEYRYGTPAQLAAILAPLLCVSWLPQILRGDAPLVLKIGLCVLAPVTVLWGAGQTLVAPVRVDDAGVWIRKRHAVSPTLLAWDDLAGYGPNAFSDRQLVLIRAGGGAVVLPELKEQGDLEVQLAKRLPARGDPRVA